MFEPGAHRVQVVGEAAKVGIGRIGVQRFGVGEKATGHRRADPELVEVPPQVTVPVSVGSHGPDDRNRAE